MPSWTAIWPVLLVTVSRVASELVNAASADAVAGFFPVDLRCIATIDGLTFTDNVKVMFSSQFRRTTVFHHHMFSFDTVIA